MNASITLWENWHEQVKEILPGVHGHQKKTLALCVLGMILSQSAVLQRMAEAIALHGKSLAKMPSIERRFARFVGNSRVQVGKIWKPFLTQVLAYWKGKAVQLVLDCTPFDDRAIIVYLGLLVHSRVLPVAWRIMPAQEQWDQGQWDPGRASCSMRSASSWSRRTVRCSLIAAWQGRHWSSCVEIASGIIGSRGGLGTYVPKVYGRLLDVIVCLPIYHPKPRAALVWTRFARAR